MGPQTQPQYTSAQLVQSFLAKNPGQVAADGTPYSKIPPAQLVPKILAKYPQYQGQISDYTPPPTEAAPEQDSGGGFGGVVKSVVSPAATIIARPFQALSDFGDYLGTKIEADKAQASGDTAGASAILAADQQRETQKQTEASGPGGIIAPQPANAADVKKDVGRGVETVALGLGPVAGGAAFGVGNSLEQGNDLFSGQTAFQAVLGAGAGKIIGLIGEPIMNAAGKQIGKITPQFLTDIASQGSKAITDFAASHDILPSGVSSAINKTANTVSAIPADVANSVKNKVLGSTAEERAAATQAKTVAATTDTLKQDPSTMTQGMKDKAQQEGRQLITTTKTGGTSVDFKPTPEIQRAGQIMSDPSEVNSPIVKGDKPNVIAAKVQNAISQKGTAAEKFLRDNPVEVTAKDETDMLNKMRSDAAEVSDAAQMKAYNDQISLFQKQLEKKYTETGTLNTSDYYEALKQYEQKVASEFSGGYEKLMDPTGVGSAKIRAASDLRAKVRDLIGAKHPEFKPQMYDLTSLYEARDNANFKSARVKPQTVFQKHPRLKIGAELAGAAVAGEGVRKLVTGGF